ncbi:hypothetical protein GCM10010401_06900 [Rarobacter faecitabidus]|uniref:Helix-turn-helix protein n=1 Tax=Rarobacter faecitabidus TaxID=13243 RepID=A0A542ZT83_RARFA|nr:hypothetical protein [Rarobacter faecitabidus]TQL63562.1 hypothetical protein FB461_0022 [Rarobacter faecitabidus]
MAKPEAKLTDRFIARAAATGMTDAAIAAAIGVTPQFYSAVKAGKEQPTTRFMIGAVRAGLAETFGEVAEPVLKAVA